MGLAWAGWHIPLFAFSEGLSRLGIGGTVGWLVSMLIGSVLMTWFFNSSCRSVLAVAIFHGVLDILMMSPVVPRIATAMGAILTIGTIASSPCSLPPNWRATRVRSRSRLIGHASRRPSTGAFAGIMKTSIARLAAKVVMVTALSFAYGSLLILLAHACGPRSAGFAFLLVWLSMCWVTLVLSAFPLRLPAAYYNLRPGERDGRRYEKVGVLVAKRVLRRGPLHIFNPKLRLPTVRDAQAWRNWTPPCALPKPTTS